MRTGDTTAGELLAQERGRLNLTIRAFARLLAGEDASNKEIEKWRRAYYRYVNEGDEPTEDLAAAMEERLGKALGYFPRTTRGQTQSGGLRPRIAELERQVAEGERRARRTEKEFAALRQELQKESPAPAKARTELSNTG